jgi:predicted RNase H-like HicB family nuclease
VRQEYTVGETLIDPGVKMVGSFTAIVQQRDSWWVGWIEEIPGVNSQGETRDELLENLHSALEEALEMNRADALAAVQDAPYEEVRVHVPA